MSRRTRLAIALTLVLTVQAPAAVAADPVDWTWAPFDLVAAPVDPAVADDLADVAVDLVAAAVDTDHDRLSDAFETNVTRTSISSADSDRDGIRDGIEDPDNDGLSNAGEQSFRTDPNDTDTDDDGISDWREDSDRDGVADGLRQDARRIPGNLMPSLANRLQDLAVVYARGCHAKPSGFKVKTCTFTYGRAAGRKTVVLTGDSHAAHWFPAVDLVARHRGWRLISMTKSSCPVADVTPINAAGVTLPDCARWHAAVRAKIRALRPDMVIASNLDTYSFVGAVNPRTDLSAKLWRQGLTRSLKSFRASSPRVIMLGDVFHWGKPAFACMLDHRNDLSRCANRRNYQAGRFGQSRDEVARRAARKANATFRPTRQIVCTYDPCPWVVDRYLVTTDGGHLTATYAAKLWRAMDRLIPAD